MNKITSFDGQTIDTSQDIWRVRTHIDGGDMIPFNWSRFETLYGDSLSVVQTYISERLQHRHASTAYRSYKSLRSFDKFLTQFDLSFSWADYNYLFARHFLIWCQECYRRFGNVFRVIKNFYQWGADNNLPDFQIEIANQLNHIKVSRDSSGHNARCGHPTKAAFIPAERELIQKAIEQKLGRDQDRVLVCLCLITGANPAPLSRLQNKDLKKIKGEYVLDIPKSKSKARERKIGHQVDLPISVGSMLETLQKGNAEDKLLHWLSKDSPTTSITTGLRRWSRECHLLSPRTDKLLHLTPRRFRCDLATRVYKDTQSELIASQVLGHKNTHTIDSYNTITPNIATHIDNATSGFFNKFSYAFINNHPFTSPVQWDTHPLHLTREESVSITPPMLRQEIRMDEIGLLSHQYFNIKFSESSERFENNVWDISHTFHREERRRVFFEANKDDKPYTQEYRLLVKFFVLSAESGASMFKRSLAVRDLWHIIQQHNFSWHVIRPDTLDTVLNYLVENFASETVWTRMVNIASFIEFLMSYGLCRSFSYNCQIELTSEKCQLPTLEAINGIIHIYHTATCPDDRLKICATLLLLITGFRVGELLTLPHDCEVNESYDGKLVYGIKYHAEKVKNAKEIARTRWLSPSMAKVAQKVISEIKELTYMARCRAKELEISDTFTLPDQPPNSWVTHKEIAKIQNLKGFKCSHLTHICKGHTYYYRTEDVAKYLSNRQQPLYILIGSKGERQALSETLFISNMFQQKTNPLFVKSLSTVNLNRFLGSIKSRKSVFERYQLYESDGSRTHLSTHRFRHLINHLLDVGGLSIANQNRWLGRQSIFYPSVYHHSTDKQKRQKIDKEAPNTSSCGNGWEGLYGA